MREREKPCPRNETEGTMPERAAIEWLKTDPNIGPVGEGHIRSMAAEIEKLRDDLRKADALADLAYVHGAKAGWNAANSANPQEAYREITEATQRAALAALKESSPDKPSRVGYGIAAAPTQEKLLAAMRWIDTFEPETTAAAEAKFGFKLFS